MKKIFLVLLLSFLFPYNALAWDFWEWFWENPPNQQEFTPYSQQIIKSIKEIGINANKASKDSNLSVDMDLKKFELETKVQAQKELLMMKYTQKLQDKIEGLQNDLCDKPSINASKQNGYNAAYKIKQAYLEKVSNYTKFGKDENAINKALANIQLQNQNIYKAFGDSIDEKGQEILLNYNFSINKGILTPKAENYYDSVTAIQYNAERTSNLLKTELNNTIIANKMTGNIQLIEKNNQIEKMIKNVTSNNNDAYDKKYEGKKLSINELLELEASQFTLSPDKIKEFITMHTDSYYSEMIRFMANNQLKQLEKIDRLEKIQFYLIEKLNTQKKGG